jgi:hypothetical protein
LSKSADILFLNDVVGSEIFGSDQNQGVILVSGNSDSSGKTESVQVVSVDRMDKDTLADLLLDQALDRLG